MLKVLYHYKVVISTFEAVRLEKSEVSAIMVLLFLTIEVKYEFF